MTLIRTPPLLHKFFLEKNKLLVDAFKKTVTVLPVE